MSGHFANLSLLVRCSDEELALLVEQADFRSFVAGRDLPPLRERLLRLERERGVTELHRRVSEKVLGAGARLMETPRDAGPLRAFALSPCGRYLAIASQRDESSLDGVLRIWELATGCVVDAVAFEGNVGGWREGSTLQWSPSGEWLGVNFDDAIVGVMRAFAGTRPSFTVDVTRRWGSPPLRVRHRCPEWQPPVRLRGRDLPPGLLTGWCVPGPWAQAARARRRAHRPAGGGAQRATRSV